MSFSSIWMTSATPWFAHGLVADLERHVRRRLHEFRAAAAPWSHGAHRPPCQYDRVSGSVLLPERPGSASASASAGYRTAVRHAEPVVGRACSAASTTSAPGRTFARFRLTPESSPVRRRSPWRVARWRPRRRAIERSAVDAGRIVRREALHHGGERRHRAGDAHDGGASPVRGVLGELAKAPRASERATARAVVPGDRPGARAREPDASRSKPRAPGRRSRASPEIWCAAAHVDDDHAAARRSGRPLNAPRKVGVPLRRPNRARLDAEAFPKARISSPPPASRMALVPTTATRSTFRAATSSA